MNILITGLGAITSAGDGTLHGSVPAAATPGPLADFDLKNYLESPKTYLDRASALSLAGCALALRDAGLTGPFDEDFGLVLGTEYGCVETMRGFENKLAESGPKAVSPLLFSHSYFNSPASLCAIEWGLKGYHATVCGPQAGLQAVQVGLDAILAGHATRMLVGAAEAWTPGRELGEDAGEATEGALFLVLEKWDEEDDARPGAVDAQEMVRRLEAELEQTENQAARNCGAVSDLLRLLPLLSRGAGAPA